MREEQGKRIRANVTRISKIRTIHKITKIQIKGLRPVKLIRKE